PSSKTYIQDAVPGKNAEKTWAIVASSIVILACINL
ncbi:unnamed protein product, partial [marine sediment metagenome]